MQRINALKGAFARPAEHVSPYLALLRPYFWTVPVIALLGTVASVFESVGIGLIIPLAAIVLDNSIGGLPAPLQAIVEMTAGFGTNERLLLLSGLLLGFVLVKAVVQSGINIFVEQVYGKVARDVQNALCEHILLLDYLFFLRTPKSRLVNIISSDSWRSADAARDVTQIMTAAIALAVFGGMLLWINWLLAIVIGIGGLSIQGMLLLIERRQRRMARLTVESNLVLAERMMAIVSAMRAIRIFGQQQGEASKFAEAAERTRLSAMATRRISASVVQVGEAVAAVLFVIVLIAGYSIGEASMPELIAFLVLLTRALPYAKAIIRLRVEIAALSGSIGEVNWLLGQQPDPASLRGTLPVPAIDQPIRLDNVSFRYRSGVPAVHDLSATIRPGTITAIIGKSGSGKTTLINLLCRLIEPSDGTVWHGSVPLADCDPREWRRHIAIAGQDIELLDGTVAENIAYGVESATQEDIELAAKAAGANRFIEALEHGYQTRLGLETLELSGGERQRLGLARALLKRPDLLILDEATSAVDSISEGEIAKLLLEHRFFRTAIVVSHRKSTLAVCDDCLVLEGGRLVETGPLAQSAYHRTM